jgi:hypothetical protein
MTTPEDAINLKAIAGSHSQRRWTTVEVFQEEIFGNLWPLYKSHQIVQSFMFQMIL